MNSSVEKHPVNSSCDVFLTSVTYSTAAMVDVTISIASHVKVLLLLLSKSTLLTSDLFVFNLTCTDLGLTIIVLLSIVSSQRLAPLWLTKFLYFFYGIVIVGRPLFQCCICVERYLAVVRPITFLKLKALKYKLPCLALAWLTTLGLGGVNVYEFDYYMTTPIFLPAFVIDCFCSHSILKALRHPRPGDNGKEEMNLTKRRAFRTIAVFQLMLVFNYIPMIIVLILSWLSLTTDCTMKPIALSFTFLGSFVHSLLYLSTAGKLPCAKQNRCGK